MPNINLKNKLNQLAILTIQHLKEYLTSGKMRIVERPYLKRVVVGFRYNKGGTGITTTYRIELHQELDEESIETLIHSISRKQEFKTALNLLIEQKNVDEIIAKGWLERFLWTIIIRYYQRRLKEADINELIDIFLDEIERGVTKCRILAWLHNIHLEDAKVELDEGVILRIPMKDDFETEIPLYPPLYEYPQPDITPSAVLEIEKRIAPKLRGPAIALGIDPTIVGRYVTALQLYKRCSAYSYYIRIEPRGVIYVGGHYKPLQLLQASTFKCTLTPDETSKVRAFINKILPKLPLDEMGNPLLNHFLGIALARYQDALLKTEPLSNKLAYAVFGLEALYLGKDEFGELKHRLAQRVAKVVHLLGKTQDPISVYEDVKKAYNIRSRFVHGGFEELKDRELLDKIAEYLRLSILVFMFAENKKHLLDLIDRSMLTEKANEELKNFLAKSIGELL